MRVKDILDMLAGGSSREEVLRDYLYLEDSNSRRALRKDELLILKVAAQRPEG